MKKTNKIIALTLSAFTLISSVSFSASATKNKVPLVSLNLSRYTINREIQVKNLPSVDIKKAKPFVYGTNANYIYILQDNAPEEKERGITISTANPKYIMPKLYAYGRSNYKTDHHIITGIAHRADDMVRLYDNKYASNLSIFIPPRDAFTLSSHKTVPIGRIKTGITHAYDIIQSIGLTNFIP